MHWNLDSWRKEFNLNIGNVDNFVFSISILFLFQLLGWDTNIFPPHFQKYDKMKVSASNVLSCWEAGPLEESKIALYQ